MAHSKTHRTLGVAFGVLFIFLAVVILILSEPADRLGSLIAAVVLGGLGLDQVVSTLKGRDSIIERIGPLP